MSIFDAGKRLIPIDIFFVEEELDNGMSKFHFINTQKEFDDWKSKGYYTQDEISSLSRPGNRNAGIAQKFEQKKVIQSVRTEWQRLTWKDQNAIFSRALKHNIGKDGKSNADLDPIIYRDLKLKLCLKRWNLSDNEGREIPVTDANIDSLLPEFATELINSFEKKTEPEDQDKSDKNGKND